VRWAIDAGQLAELTGLTMARLRYRRPLEEAGYVRRERVKSDRRKVLIHRNLRFRRDRRNFNDLGQAVQEAVMRYDDQQLAVIRDFLSG